MRRTWASPIDGEALTFDGPESMGMTVFAQFAAETHYFGDGPQQFMVNFRVDDLDGLAGAARRGRSAHRSQARRPPLRSLCLDLGSRRQPRGAVGADGGRRASRWRGRLGAAFGGGPAFVLRESDIRQTMSYNGRQVRRTCLTRWHSCRTSPGGTLSRPAGLEPVRQLPMAALARELRGGLVQVGAMLGVCAGG